MTHPSIFESSRQRVSLCSRQLTHQASRRNKRFQKLTRRERNWEGVGKKNLREGNETGRKYEKITSRGRASLLAHSLHTSPQVFAHPRHAPSLARFFTCLFDLRLEKERKRLLRRLSLWLGNVGNCLLKFLFRAAPSPLLETMISFEKAVARVLS